MVKGLLVAAFVLVCLGVIAVSYIVPKIHVQERDTGSGGRVSVETPFGSVHVNGRKDAATDLGDVPVYPGAEHAKKDGGGAVVDIDFGGGEKRFSVAGAEFVTDDSVAKVREWYRDHLPGWEVKGKEMVHVEKGVKHVVAVTERDGRTRIGIATIGGEPAAN